MNMIFECIGIFASLVGVTALALWAIGVLKIEAVKIQQE